MLKNLPLYAIFPLFVLYNIGLLYELYESVGVGYYSIIYPVVALLLGYRVFKNNNFKLGQTDYLFAIYIFSSVVIYLANSAFMSIEKISYYFQILVMQMIIYLSVRQFEFSWKNIKIISLLFWIIAVCLTLKMEDSWFVYFDSYKGMSTYQGLSRSLVLTSLIVIYTVQRRLQWLYFIVTVFILFILGSRSEFALFLVGLFAVSIMNGRKTIIKLASIVLAIFLLGIMYNPSTANDLLKISRIFSLIDPQSALKEGGRSELTESAINTLGNHILLGDITNVNIGSSSHNILSSWEINGVFFFLLTVGISCTNFILRARDFVHLSTEFYAKIAFFYSVLWLIGMCTSYWYGNEMFALALGFGARLEVFKSGSHV